MALWLCSCDSIELNRHAAYDRAILLHDFNGLDMILNIKLDEIDPAAGDVGHYLVSCRWRSL